jgi:hypothetical protein
MMTLRLACLLLVLLVPAAGPTGQGRGQKPPAIPGPMLDQGLMTVDTPEFTLDLVRSSQTVAALKPKGSAGFDFTPGDLLVERSQNGYYHLGDLDVRVRVGGSKDWKDYSTSAVRRAVVALPASGTVLAAADLTPTFPSDIPLQVTRSWRVESGKLVLRFELKNRTTEPVQIGALGIPMIFNSVLSNRSLDQAHAACVFYDPYIGEDAGYVQVTRLSGGGPALVVVPDGRTPFEAYNPILNPHRSPGAGGAADARRAVGSDAPLFTDATPRGQTFEGFFDWMVLSQAFAEREWQQARPWNPPTSVTLAPDASVSYGVAFVLADGIRGIESALAANGRPVAIGIPGYVVPMDIEGRLFLRYSTPVRSVDVEPRDALVVSRNSSTAGGWQSYTLRGKSWGRARVAVTYDDGTVQAIHYYVTRPAAEAVTDLGRFLTTRQWFVDPADPFKRSPSAMTYDREENRIVLQDSRVWIAGLGDEGGSSWLTGMMKQLGQPETAEIEKYQEFVDKVLWGGLQYADGPRKYGVRKSLFYYQPDQMPAGYYRSDFNWSTWTSWNKEATEGVDRSYDYPHVAALHWTMYRLARNHAGLVTNHPWVWYLTNAYQTSVAMVTHAPRYAQFGQMEGTVFLEILRDLKREGWAPQAVDMESRMKARVAVWSKLAYPFGSEMPWDSTGQEEVYAWTKYFGDVSKSLITLNAILGYMPTLPHWGYNGSARRYWDFLYGGKLRRIERQLHHYGSGLNAIPVLSEYRDHPDDEYLLRVGYGGLMGALTSIDEEGFASAAFHSFPDTLRHDAISGDYAQNFFGHALNTATYVIRHPEFGWQAFGGNVAAGAKLVAVTPLDSFRTRVYLAPLGLWLTLDAGRFERIEVNPDTRRVRLALAPATPLTPAARLRLEQPAAITGVGTYAPIGAFATEREASVIPLKSSTTWIEVAPLAKHAWSLAPA